jgi:hypothetical protein
VGRPTRSLAAPVHWVDHGFPPPVPPESSVPVGCPYVFGQAGRLVIDGVWNDVCVHAGDQVGEGVPAELAVFPTS